MYFKAAPDPDGEASWPAEVKEAVGYLRRKDFAVWPNGDGRWRIEATIVSQHEMIERAADMQRRRM